MKSLLGLLHLRFADSNFWYFHVYYVHSCNLDRSVLMSLPFLGVLMRHGNCIVGPLKIIMDL